MSRALWMLEAEWTEEKHPRDKGKFAHTAGASGGKAADAAHDHAADYKANGTKAKAFKEWFGTSKVVDANGEPLVVYHGSKAQFDSFRPDETGRFGQERFHMFDPDPEYPEQLGPKVYRCYLSLKNPLISESISGYDISMGTFDKAYFTKQGYDGVKTKEGWWIAFDPTQIKAVDNEGTFNPKSPKLRESKDSK